MPITPKKAAEPPKPAAQVEEVFIPEEPKWSLDEIILSRTNRIDNRKGEMLSDTLEEKDARRRTQSS